jgi:alkaline phosphatase D
MTTRRALLAALAAAGVLPAGAHAFSYGVTSAEVTPHSALLWTRADDAGPVTLRVGGRTFTLTATDATDLTVQRRVTGLKAGTAYRYVFAQGARRAAGRFRTAPAPSRSAPVSFALTGDADALGAYNDFQVYDRMAREHNDFNVNLGDTIYSDSEVPGAVPALTVSDKWAKYRANLAEANLRRVRATASMYNHWDDHEFINDYTRDESGGAIYDAGVQAFRDYMPVTYTSARGIYRSFRWGRNLEVFFLDERSFRSAKASANHACDNPDTGAPDLFPTLPQQQRDLFARLEPSLAKQPPASCLAALGDPRRTMLGAAQYARFTSAIRRSKATWKVVVNEVPIMQLYALPYDRWEGYAAERAKLLAFLQAKVRNVVFLTTDHHADLVGKAAGMSEFVTGPVATRTFAKEIDDDLGRPGSASLVAGAFFKPPPPNGLGLQCAALDSYSYAQVKVTATRLRVAVKDLDGHTVKDSDGRNCGPYVLRARRSAPRRARRAAPRARRS